MKRYQNIFFAAFLIISLFIRLLYIDNAAIPKTYSDSLRDYLIADHIISFGEVPLIGHSNFFLNNIGLRNSPIYYYLLAIFLIPYNNIFVLIVINVFLQLSTLVLIFLITKLFFGFRTAIMAAILFGFIPFVLSQSENIWQPWVMQTVALFALYLLSLAFLKKNYKFLIAAISFLVLAISIHFSAASWLPLFILLSFLYLKLEKKKIVHYVGILATLILVAFIFHFPVLIYLLDKEFLADPRTIYPQSINNYFINIIHYFQDLNLNTVIVLVLTLGLIGYLFLEKSKRWITVVGLGFFLSTILSASFLQHPINIYGTRYITLSFSIFAIIVSVIANFYFNKINNIILKFNHNNYQKINILRTTCWFLIFLFLLKIFSQDFSFLNNLKTSNNINGKYFLEEVVYSVESKVFDIKKKEKYDNPDFFHIISFTNKNTFSSKTEHRTLEDSWLLMPLEKNLNHKLTNLPKSSYFEQLNRDDYIFLVCYDRYVCNKSLDCTGDFLVANANYFLVERIYSKPTISIFLLKKSSI